MRVSLSLFTVSITNSQYISFGVLISLFVVGDSLSQSLVTIHPRLRYPPPVARSDALLPNAIRRPKNCFAPDRHLPVTRLSANPNVRRHTAPPAPPPAHLANKAEIIFCKHSEPVERLPHQFCCSSGAEVWRQHTRTTTAAKEGELERSDEGEFGEYTGCEWELPS